MPPTLQDKVPWASSLHPDPPMDIPGGANPVPCAQPCSCRGKLSLAQLKVMLKASPQGCWGLAWLHEPKTMSQGVRGRPKKEGDAPFVAAGLCYPKESSSTGCPSL